MEAYDPVFGSARYIKATAHAPAFSLHDPLPLFRRTFTLSENELGQAKLLIQSPGFARVYLNGKPITEELFISPLSDYGKLLWYNAYDVTDLIHVGENVIGAIAGNGYFNESFDSAWHFASAAWRDAPQLMLRLTIDGKEAVVSDERFKVSREHSHIIFSHLRSGEYVDMRKYDEAWLMPAYDDTAWRPATVRDPAEIGGELRLLADTGCPPVRETERIAPVAITKTRDGYLVDFGTTQAGYMEITLSAPRGQEITFRYCEEIDGEMRPKHNRMDRKHFYGEDFFAFQTNKLIASGGVDTFKPLFSYHGFRYVLIEGLKDKPKESDICAYFIHNDVPRKADFSSGNEILNYIYRAGIRSTESNLFWSFTDCPTREKLGWMNDAQATAEQALINFDIVGFYRKWFEDIKADQGEEGEMHGVIPTWGWGLGWGPVCDLCLYEIPYRIYVYTGDASMLTGAIPQFLKYIRFLDGKIAEDHDFELGDWMGNGNSPRIPKAFVRGFYLLKALRITLLAHRLGGKPCDALARRYDGERERFLSRYLDADGRCTVDEQTSCAMMIAFGLYHEKEPLLRQLVSAVLREDIRLTCGMVGVQYLYDALSECGRPDLAYRLITESEPGYKTWYKHGATTLWECWDGEHNGSHNHHMFSNVLAWFFKSLLGIAPREETPAFAKIELSPCFIKEAGFVSGYEDTVRGRIEAAWRYEGGGFTYTVTIPEGVCARFDGKILPIGTSTFFIKEKRYEDHSENG
ncbi:MAG: family 78 glycoside hydrolase catalytic domain [Clostridia bacterium]|nr:family 78 glycoside hydrolase catalytic domain [Clostridia bacterium]